MSTSPMSTTTEGTRRYNPGPFFSILRSQADGAVNVAFGSAVGYSVQLDLFVSPSQRLCTPIS